jgi:hypothetical protein
LEYLLSVGTPRSVATDREGKRAVP